MVLQIGGVYLPLSPQDGRNARSASSGEHLKWVGPLISDSTLHPLFLSTSQSQEIIESLSILRQKERDSGNKGGIHIHQK